jgi:hypothetical protein
VNDKWVEKMDQSLHNSVSEPNDELLWKTILPKDVLNKGEYWWGDRAQNIWTKAEFSRITTNTYFAHVRNLQWAGEIRDHYKLLTNNKKGNLYE